MYYCVIFARFSECLKRAVMTQTLLGDALPVLFALQVAKHTLQPTSQLSLLCLMNIKKTSQFTKPCKDDSQN